MYLNFHTHKFVPNQFAIYNIVAGEPIDFPIIAKNKYSFGVHPWYPLPYFQYKKDLEIQFNDKNIIAIGECGLDKLARLNLKEQTEIFKWHIHFSELLQKPLIIHCVKAYNEVFEIYKETNPTQPWIFHGFNNSNQVLDQFLPYTVYFSVGELILKSNSKISKSICHIPIHRLFLETDNLNVSIEDIYSKVSEITGQSINTLQMQINSNFAECFKINF